MIAVSSFFRTPFSIAMTFLSPFIFLSNDPDLRPVEGVVEALYGTEDRKNKVDNSPFRSYFLRDIVIRKTLQMFRIISRKPAVLDSHGCDR